MGFGLRDGEELDEVASEVEVSEAVEDSVSVKLSLAGVNPLAITLKFNELI